MTKLAYYSKNKLTDTFTQWNVDADFSDPIYNYLVYGYEPGSCFTAVLANDFMDVMLRSHPANTVGAFKALAGWIKDCMPTQAYGSYHAVAEWVKLTSAERRDILEKSNLIYTEKQEMWLALKGKPVDEYALY